MPKRIISLFLILISLVLILCSCGDDDDVTLVVPIASDPLCIDPQVADNASARLLVVNCYEGLVRLGAEGEIQPGVAENWDISADGKTYTFHLREDSKWQLLNSHKDIYGADDYKETVDATVKASDFVFGLQRALNPQTQSSDADKLYCIQNAKRINEGEMPPESLGVRAADSKTVIITLERANADFLRLLTMPVCMPCNKEFFELTHAKYGMEMKYTMCNGPFYLGKWTDDNTLTIYRNEGYKGNVKVKPASVYFNVNQEEESVLTKLKQNSYDIAALSDSMRAELAENSKINQVSINNTVTGLCFNCVDGTMKETDIRRVLLMLTKYHDSDFNAQGIVPDCVRFGEKSYRETVGKTGYVKYDEKKAVELWKKALNKIGVESADVSILCTEQYSETMKALIQNWQKVLGTTIIAKVIVKTQDEIDTAITGKNYQIVVGNVKAETSTVTDMIKKFTTSDKNNIFDFSSAKYDALVEEIINTADGKEITAKCLQAEKMLITNGVFCPLYKGYSYMAVNKNLSGEYIEPSFENVCFVNGGID